jgi:predicted nucleic acid-binding protein
VSFVDTNVLVYSTAAGSPFQERARAALVRLMIDEQLFISRQILREYLAVMTRQQVWGKALSLSEAISDTLVFTQRFSILEDGLPVWQQLTELGRRYSFGGRQVHDANIVATMLAHGERRLLTFNDPDFQRFNELIEIVVP